MTGSCAQASQQIGVAQYADHSPSLPDPLCTTDTRAGRRFLGDKGLDAAWGKPAESSSVRARTTGNGFDSAKVPIRICALNCKSIYALYSTQRKRDCNVAYYASVTQRFTLMV